VSPSDVRAGLTCTVKKDEVCMAIAHTDEWCACRTPDWLTGARQQLERDGGIEGTLRVFRWEQ